MQVTVFNTQTNQPARITSNATTWGQLKAELTSQRINFSGMKVMVQQTKVTLESDDAVLPTSDYTIFLFPLQVKSGGMSPEDLSEEMDEKFNEMSAKLDRILSILGTRDAVSSYGQAPVPQRDSEADRLAAEAAKLFPGASGNPYRGW